MNKKVILSNKLRLKILKVSNIYGGILSLIFVGMYIIFVIASPFTLRYVLLQAILLPLGVVLSAVFSYLHLSYSEEIPEEFTCSLLSGLTISSTCIVPGLIITFFEIRTLSYGIIPASLLIIFILGVPSLVLGILSLFIVLKGNRTVPKGLERWKIRGLQLGTVILITGVVVAGSSMSVGLVGNTKITYTVMLGTSEETTFFIPMPIDELTGEVADVMNELEVVEGVADWKIVDTAHGQALEVHTKGVCVLSAEKECGYKGWEEGDEWLYSYNVSMLQGTNKTIYEVWVFASAANTTMRMRLLMDDGINNALGYTPVGSTPFGPFTYDVLLKEGWQTVRLERPPPIWYD